jgi:molybdopterin converting factor small subunit
VNIIINGRHIMFYDINEIVKEDLLIDILPPVSGGS